MSNLSGTNTLNGGNTSNSGGSASGVAAAVTGAGISNPTYSTVQDAINLYNSTGVTSGGAITSNGDGTIAIAAGTGGIRSSDSNLINLYFFDFAAVPTLSLTDNSINYIYVNYNGGSPNITASITRSTDFNSKILLGQVYRSGTSLSINTSVKQISANTPDLQWRQNLEVIPFSNASGGALSEVGTLNIAITAGSWWNGYVPFTTPSFDSSAAGTFTYWYRNGSGGWTSQASQTQINNTQYDNGTGTLATLTGGRYGLAWVFTEVSGAIHVLFGQGDYTLTQADSADVPSSLPPVIAANGRILAKITILKSASAFTSIDSALKYQFQFQQPTDHNSLSNLQGGQADEYYHFTNAQHTTLGAFAGLDSSAGYLVQTAANTFAKRTLTGTTNQISITNGDGTTDNPVFSLPQNINTGASPQFTGLNLSGLTASQAVVTDASKNFASLGYASANTVSTLVQRDGSGNFSAGTITATLSGNATTATTLQTPRAIYGNNFDGSAALTQIIASTYGGTGNGFTKFSGPTTSEKTFTLPDASATLLYSGGALGTPSSGVATNLTGTASGLTAGNVTTNANLTGAVTSVGNATSLGSFTSANLASALTDEIGTGNNVFGTVSAGSESSVQLGGFIFKMGKKTGVTATDVTVTFANAFPSNCYGAVVCASGQSLNVAPGSKSFTTSNFVIDNNGGSTTDVQWFAWGN